MNNVTRPISFITVRTALAIGCALMLAPAGARAQTTTDGFSLGLTSGFAQGPASPFSSSSLGYYVLPTLEFPSFMRVFRPRVDGLFADWGAGRATALTGNLLFTPISGKRVAPYLLAGAGAYAMPGAGVKAGWTLGAGLRLPSALRAITIESRVHAFLRARPRDGFIDTPLGRVWAPEGRWGYIWAPIGLGIQF